MAPHLGLQRIMIPSAQVSSLTTGAITLPSARGSFIPPETSGYYSIATTTLSSASSTITFNTIPTDFTDLEIRGLLKVDYTADMRGIDCRMNFNGEATGTNYTLHDFRGYGASYDNANSSNGTSRVLIYSGAMANYSGYGSYYGAFQTQIFSYKKTDRYKTGYYISSSEAAINNNEHQVSYSGFGYKSLDPITSITFTASYGTGFVAGTTLALYGIGSGAS